MSTLDIALLLAVLGLFIGSFVGANVWRLRAYQLREDEKAGEEVSASEKREVRKLKKTALIDDRSVCLHCGHQLMWYDLIPLLSWLQLGGKCRYCHKPIGWLEPIVEISMAAVFGLSYIFWPMQLSSPLEAIHFSLWLVTCVGLAMLFIYDAKWFLLPNRVVFPLIGVGVLNSLIVLYQAHFSFDAIMNVIYACLVLSGLYYLIYVASRYQWVGYGDIKLGLALALMLADWRLAALALFLANVIGTLMVLPLMISGKIERGTHISFGPLLISGWFFAGLFGLQIIHWYLSFTLGIR